MSTTLRPSATPPSRVVPRPLLTEVRNLTPFRDVQFQKMGVGRSYFDIVVLHGTFDMLPGKATLADEQDPVSLADESFDPELGSRSSLRVAGDLVWTKRATDLIVSGSARVDRPRSAWEATVELKGHASARSTLQVTGPRRWEHRRLLGWALSDPDPTTEVPIRYELAYGGWYRDPIDADAARIRKFDANPSGCGFVDTNGLGRDTPVRAPQWQSPAYPVSDMNVARPLAGFGAVQRSWASRTRLGGTYDEAWRARAKSDASMGIPVDYPADFDPRFFQAAHPHLTADGIVRGDETLRLDGLVQGVESFVTALPGLRVRAHLYLGMSPWVDIELPLDTLHVDIDAGKLHTTWRLVAPRAAQLRAAVFSCEETK